MSRSGVGRRRVLLVGLAVWTLLPLALLGVVSLSGGWRFPTLLGVAPGSVPWSATGPGGGALGGALLTSGALAVLTGIVAAGLGLPLGRSLSRMRGWTAGIGAACAFLPVAAPPIALGVGLQITFLALGLGGSFVGVLLAHAIPAIGYTSLFFLGVFAGFDPRIEEEARGLGAGAVQTLFRVTLPLLRRPLAEAFVLGFLVSWAQVPLTLLVGQGRVRTLTVEVLAWLQAGQDPLAAAGSTLLAVPPLLLMALAGLAIRRAEVVAP